MKQALEYLGSFLILALIASGLTGIAYHLFRQDGWIESLTGSLWGATMRSPLMALVVVVGVAAVVALRWRNRQVRRDEGSAATVVFYAMIAAGVFFLGRFLVVGTF